MRALDVITAFDNMRPNTVDFQKKLSWLRAIETEVRNYTCLYMESDADLSFADEENPILYLGDADMDIYLYYLISMLDMLNGEYRLYNVSSTYFNGLFDKWKRAYREKNKPLKNTGIKY